MCGGEETVSIGAAAASSAWCKATSSRTECSGYETMHGRVSLRAVGMKLIKKLSRDLIFFLSFCLFLKKVDDHENPIFPILDF